MVNAGGGGFAAKLFCSGRHGLQEIPPLPAQGLTAKVAAVANFKGGVGKTSAAAYLAMSAALDGYKVLVIDLDSHGSMTLIMGGKVTDEWKTVLPPLAKENALAVQEQNRLHEARHNPPLCLDETLTVNAADFIQKTQWANIDQIGAQLNLYWAEFQVPVWRMVLRNWPL